MGGRGSSSMSGRKSGAGGLAFLKRCKITPAGMLNTLLVN